MIKHLLKQIYLLVIYAHVKGGERVKPGDAPGQRLDFFLEQFLSGEPVDVKYIIGHSHERHSCATSRVHAYSRSIHPLMIHNILKT